ncbi:hypothetical protein IIC68_02965, partial [archaeon]|nr:hypothetical protein [archaeon]
MVLIDLKESGLPLKLQKNKLIFGRGMTKVIPEARTRERMGAVLKDKKAKAPQEFYYMYRDVCLEKDRREIRKNDLRYDITVLPPFTVGGEYNKTFGHYHPKIPKTRTYWPEIYEVLHGKAHYLLQSDKEFLVFEARKGDKCVMLPGFAHVTVNPGSETLVMANWVYPGFKSDYLPIEKKKGVHWYETEQGFIPNKNYSKQFPIQLITPKEFEQFGVTKRPMYKEAMAKPENFKWLVKPQ